MASHGNDALSPSKPNLHHDRIASPRAAQKVKLFHVEQNGSSASDEVMMLLSKRHPLFLRDLLNGCRPPWTRDGQPTRHHQPSLQPIHARGLALKNFTSQWFLVPQGTGILAVVLHQQHYQFRGLGSIATCCWVLTIAMLAAMLLVYLAHAVRYPSHVRSQLQRNAMETACLASMSIAFTTVI